MSNKIKKKFFSHYSRILRTCLEKVSPLRKIMIKEELKALFDLGIASVNSVMIFFNDDIKDGLSFYLDRIGMLFAFSVN